MFKELSKLFTSSNRIKLLKFFSSQPLDRFTAADAAASLGMPKKTADVELKALARLGIIQKRSQPKKVWYAYAPQHQYADAVKAFLDATTQPADKTISSAFRGVGGTTMLVASGVLTRDPRSSLDLLIVTRRPKHPGIPKAVKKIESGVALPLRYAVLEAKEYKGRLEANDRLLRDVFDFAHRVVMGRV